MPSGFDSLFASAALPSLQDFHGEISDVTYADVDFPAGFLLTKVLVEELENDDDDELRRFWVNRVELTAGGVVDAKRNASLTLDGKKWRVDDIRWELARGGMVPLDASRANPHSHGGI